MWEKAENVRRDRWVTVLLSRLGRQNFGPALWPVLILRPPAQKYRPFSSDEKQLYVLYQVRPLLLRANESGWRVRAQTPDCQIKLGLVWRGPEPPRICLREKLHSHGTDRPNRAKVVI